MKDYFEVRRGRVGDVHDVLALERETAEAPHWSEEDYRTVVSPVEKGIERCLFVAEEKDRLLGFAVGSLVAGTGEVESVAVAAVARRRGVGAALCRGVLAWCGERGATQVDLEVRASSVGAIRMYRGLGFVETGWRAGYYARPNEDALLMRLLV